VPDPESLPDVLESTRRFADRILAGLGDRPVAHPPAPVAPEPVPLTGIGFDAALAAFARRWEPGFSGSAGPRYLGFVTGGATPAALAGDWLTSTFDQNAVAGDSSAADLERETARWLATLLGLGAEHTGTFVTGATMSNFVGLAIGREWLGDQRGISVASAGVHALGPVHVLSGTPHSTVRKALSMIGIGSSRLVEVALLPDREAVDPGDVPQAARPARVVHPHRVRRGRPPRHRGTRRRGGPRTGRPPRRHPRLPPAGPGSPQRRLLHAAG
jgi:hypothetical protein